MEIKQLLQAHCLFILTHFISAQSEVTLDDEKKNIYVSPGSDVNLTCTIQKEKRAHVTQTQWSKIVDGKPERLAVYNPLYGTTHISSLEKANSSASFKDAAHCDQSDSSRIRDSNAECNQWILQLRNVSLEWAGVYECSFAIFPAGIKTSEIHLIIKQDDKKTYVVEILLNQTLEIPCFQDKPSANLDKVPLTWLMQEEDGTEVILITKEYYYQTSYVTNATKYKERIKMDPDNTLRISPILVIDNGKKFICSIAEHPGRTMKSITEVKVFVKPEIIIYPSSAEKDSLTCVIRKAFPKPNLMWFVDGMILNNKFEDEVTKDAEGFYELRSQLTTGSTATSSIPQTFKCMSLYPFLGNEIWNVSAEETVLPFGFQTMSSPFLDLISQTVSVSNSHTEQYQATSPSLEFISQIAPTSDSPTEGFQMISSMSLETRTQVTPVSNFHMERSSHSPKNVPNETNTTLSSYSTVTQSNPSIRRVTEFITLTNRGNLSTLKGLVVLSGDTSPGHIKFSWPAVVSSMLLICTVLIIVAIQKWCHYQKEIMNRPPSFKPPPPPIKYTPMHDTDGIYLSCNQLENL